MVTRKEMNRENKYRVWDAIDKRMIVHKQDYVPLIITNFGIMKLNPHIEKNNYYFIDNNNRFVLMQYTERKDKNGIEIYEEDLVKGYCHNIKKIFKVVFKSSKYCCGFVATDNLDANPYVELWYEGFEVIGNIYENPELLK